MASITVDIYNDDTSYRDQYQGIVRLAWQRPESLRLKGVNQILEQECALPVGVRCEILSWLGGTRVPSEA